MREQLTSILQRISAAAERVGRDPREVTVTAVTKTVPPDRIREYEVLARALGLRPVIGESYLTEFAAKVEFIDLSVEKRFIGVLSASQVPRIWRLFDVIETLGDFKTMEACAAQMKKGGNVPRLLIQVNISEDPGKAGFYPNDIAQALVFARESRLRIGGFMTITERYDEGCDDVRRDYRALAALARQLRESREFHEAPFESSSGELSMGMSADFEVAVEEGATHIRLGSSLFGKRPAR